MDVGPMLLPHSFVGTTRKCSQQVLQKPQGNKGFSDGQRYSSWYAACSSDWREDQAPRFFLVPGSLRAHIIPESPTNFRLHALIPSFVDFSQSARTPRNWKGSCSGPIRPHCSGKMPFFQGA